jgi:hypothetical protein
VIYYDELYPRQRGGVDLVQGVTDGRFAVGSQCPFPDSELIVLPVVRFD